MKEKKFTGFLRQESEVRHPRQSMLLPVIDDRRWSFSDGEKFRMWLQAVGEVMRVFWGFFFVCFFAV